MHYQSLIGLKEEQETYEVERGQIRRFALAVGDSNPLHFDEGYAVSQGYLGLVAPPTFPTTFRPDRPSALFERLTGPPVLHGEQEFRYQRPIVAGDRVTIAGKVTQVYSKTGGSGLLWFIVQERQGRDARGELLYTERMTLVIRPQAGGE